MMRKIIHCADLHLDSKLTANLPAEKVKIRKIELLHTYQRMIQFARENQVDAILIAGDLFDTANVSATARNTLLQSVLDNPQIDFYYLKGNHDTRSFFSGLDKIPVNLKLFGDEWTYYSLDSEEKIVVAGVEISKENAAFLGHSLALSSDKYNIVMLHGQESEYRGKDKTDCIPLRELRGKGIDYLALGHVHEYKKGVLDGRGTWCYSGCLEGRGFDECGEHGFVLLHIDTSNGEVNHRFIPFAYRNLYTVQVDVSDAMTTDDISKCIRRALEEQALDEKHLIRIVLTGKVDVSCEISLELLTKQWEDRFYYLKIYDETKRKVDEQSFLLDESLKGEFVRTVLADDTLSETEKAQIIHYGIQALSGEEIQ